MPRKSYTPKNPYLKNAKVSKEQYEFIYSAWLEGKTATETARALKENGEKLSRQTVQNMFTKIGKHIWETRFKPQYEAKYIDEEILEKSRQNAENMGLELTDDEIKHRLLQPVLQSIRLNALGKLNYRKFRDKWGTSPDNEKPYKLLREQSRKANGLPSKNFECHIARAMMASQPKHRALNAILESLQN